MCVPEKACAFQNVGSKQGVLTLRVDMQILSLRLGAPILRSAATCTRMQAVYSNIYRGLHAKSRLSARGLNSSTSQAPNCVRRTPAMNTWDRIWVGCSSFLSFFIQELEVATCNLYNSYITPVIPVVLIFFSIIPI